MLRRWCTNTSFVLFMSIWDKMHFMELVDDLGGIDQLVTFDSGQLNNTSSYELTPLPLCFFSSSHLLLGSTFLSTVPTYTGCVLSSVFWKTQTEILISPETMDKEKILLFPAPSLLFYHGSGREGQQLGDTGRFDETLDHSMSKRI